MKMSNAMAGQKQREHRPNLDRVPLISFPIGHYMKNNLIAPRLKKSLLLLIQSMIIIEAALIKSA